jgi:hypothetical protein
MSPQPIAFTLPRTTRCFVRKPPEGAPRSSARSGMVPKRAFSLALADARGSVSSSKSARNVRGRERDCAESSARAFCPAD